MSAHAGHRHGSDPSADQRWLLAALALVVVFMVVEVTAGLLAHSTALIADAGHMLTDAAALLLAVIAARLAVRPARGAYTYGFARVDALAGQANGITLVLLALWFTVQGIAHLVRPAGVHGSTVAVVAALGAVVNVVATVLAGRADRSSLNVRGVMAHLISDVWAFGATFLAGVVVVATGWTRADAVATLLVAALMAWTGSSLVRDAGRVFLDAAPAGLDPQEVGGRLAQTEGVAEVHDLHVWTLSGQDTALSAHVLVHPTHDCHQVASRLRAELGTAYGIGHVTLQVDHAEAGTHLAAECTDAHGTVHVAPSDGPRLS